MSQPNNMTRLEVVDIETLEVKKAIYLAGHNAQEIQAMSDSLLRNVNTFQFFVRAVLSAGPVAVEADQVALPGAAIWNAITRLERTDSTQEERFAAADGLRAIAPAPAATSGA